MSVQNALNTGIYSTLTGNSTLTGLLATSTSAYYAQAPDNATLPFVVWSYQGGGPDNQNPSDMRSILLYVRGYATAPATAGSIDTHAGTTLHGGSVTVAGYTNFYSVRETDFHSVETLPNGEQVYSAGAVYRIRLDS